MMNKKNRHKLYSVIVVVFFTLYVGAQQNILPLIPQPKSLVKTPGHFSLTSTTKLVVTTQSIKDELVYFNDYLKKHYGFVLEVTSKIPKKGNYIIFTYPDWEAGLKENYHLTINETFISIIAESEGAGNFYAIQSLIQLLPLEKTTTLNIPCLQIKDAPLMKWRGMHLDVCRHFFSIDFIKKYIDLLALYKMNTFHWHLTDDQGWRIEIKKYPKLTQVGAWRNGTMIGAYSNQEFDTIKYGGFYTQEQIKDVVTYAAQRHITIVPEIEMPGHAVAAISAYPFLSCDEKQIDVERGWGVFENVFCTKDTVFNFLEDVLSEVMDLFPGKYIHVGGDECPKTKWKTCNHCQSRIKTEKLKDEHELQSYFITRIEKFVNSKGRQIIGWDEILEGGLAPNAAVMSWRGTEGGINAAKQKHKVVMSPGTHCYFDHFQGDPIDEPLAFGGYTPLQKVYSFNPIPTELNESEKQYILGAQANVWTEYILNDKHVEYMANPRMAALSEVLWSPNENRNSSHFVARLQKHFLLLDKLNFNYSKALYNVEQITTSSKSHQAINLELKADSVLGKIYYTIDGSNPKIKSIPYKNAITISNNTTVKAALFKNEKQLGKISQRNYEINLATNKSITLAIPPSKSYNYGGAFTLINGVVASLPRTNNQWLGWSGKNLEAVIDLKQLEEIKTISVGFLKEEVNWIYLPKEAEVYISNDGQKYISIGKMTLINERFMEISVSPTKTRYVKIIVNNYGLIPEGNPGAGSPAWLFCDEIQIK